MTHPPGRHGPRSSRRRTLLGLAALGAVAGTAAYVTSAAAGSPLARLRQKLREVGLDRADTRSTGTKLMQYLGDHESRRILEQALPELDAACAGSACVERLRTLVREDFMHARIVVADGLNLARTEAAVLLALAREVQGERA